VKGGDQKVLQRSLGIRHANAAYGVMGIRVFNGLI